GAADTGKTHLARLLLARLAGRGGRPALLGTDVGQPPIGAPACLAVAVDPPWERATASWFVGAVTPARHLLPIVGGGVALAQVAREAGADALVVDTDGLVAGGFGRAFRYHQALALGATDVVVLERGGEMAALRALLARPDRTIHRVRPADAAHARSRETRRAFREERFAAHLAGGRTVALRRARLLGPEWTPDAPAAEAPPGTLVGLLDASHLCLGLGVVLDARPDALVVHTPCAALDRVAWVRLGDVRLP